MERFGRAILYIITTWGIGLILSFLTGLFIMLLWNWLMPTIFGLCTITYWQAYGVSLLSTLIFKPIIIHENR